MAQLFDLRPSTKDNNLKFRAKSTITSLWILSECPELGAYADNLMDVVDRLLILKNDRTHPSFGKTQTQAYRNLLVRHGPHVEFFLLTNQLNHTLGRVCPTLMTIKTQINQD